MSPGNHQTVWLQLPFSSLQFQKALIPCQGKAFVCMLRVYYQGWFTKSKFSIVRVWYLTSGVAVCLVSCKRLWQQSVCCFIELWCEQAGCLCNVQHGQLRMTTCLSQWKLNGRKPQQIIPKSRVGNVERMESCKNVKSCGDVAERWVGGLISLYYIQKKGLMMKRVLLCSRSTSMPTLRPSFWTLFQPSELCWTAASPISSSTG